VADPSQMPARQFGRASEDSDIEDLKARLAEAEETIRAFKQGEVDALVVNGPSGPQVYTLQGADHPYRILVEQMHDGTLTIAPDGLVLYSNGRFAAMIGAPVDSVAGMRFGQFLTGTDSSVFSGLVEAAATSGHSAGDLNLRAPDGSRIPIRVSLTALDVAGMQNLCMVISDLREQRRNEALVKEEQLSRLILEQAGEAIVVIDPRGIIVRRSESAFRLAGLTALMNRFDDVFPLAVHGLPLETGQILESARAGEHIKGLEATMLHPDGTTSALLISVSPLWRDGNELLGCVITLTDITERKRAEEALARQAEELAMSNSDLRQFAYSASHDLREPLRHVAVFSQLLQSKYQEKLDDEAAELIRHTVGSAHRMEVMLKDLLAYTNAADAPQGPFAPIDANESARKTLTLFEPQIKESGAVVDCGSLPLLAVHEVHLIQLFQNLIGNALKYRSAAPPIIHVSAQRADALWELSVTDNGIGIDPGYQRQIFGLFQRLHGGSKYSGSGIGLAICQKIVQRYGGKIWVESAVGSGSRFTFTLPGVNQPGTQPGAHSQAKPGAHHPGAHHPGANHDSRES
jgi:PAS domain S-box-containing protein